MILPSRTPCKYLPQKFSEFLKSNGHILRYGSPPVRHIKRTLQGGTLRRRYTPCVHLRRGVATNSTSRRVFIPSPEQQAIVDLCRLQNVIVSARPGAGKTATAVAIVDADPKRPIAVLTYSKRLQLDTAKRLTTYPESDVYTFHALACRLYSTSVPNDSALRALRKQGRPPIWTGKQYEAIILDELQDCTDNLFWLIGNFIKAVTSARCGRPPRIVALGDERQTIYAFKGADSRYLSLASSTMATLSPYPWNNLALNKSFRLSHQNTAFVNNAFLGGEKYIIGSHSGPVPLYLLINSFNALRLAEYLVPLIRQYGPERTAILAPSVRQNIPVQNLTNHLSEAYGILVAEPQSDDAPLDENVLRGKICVSTYHQFKGNERDLVITYGVDASYFIFHGKDLPDDVCPNTIFVALTRAHKQLVVIHDNRREPMPFIHVEELQKTANVVNVGNTRKVLKSGTPGRPIQVGLQLPVSVAASELPRHIPDEIIDDIVSKHLYINQALPQLPSRFHLDAPSIVLTDPVKEHYEAVSDLNGLAVVAAYEYASQKTLTTLGKSRSSYPKDLSNATAQSIWLCREACNYEARVSGYKSRKLQMKGHPFDWLASYLDAARSRLEEQFSEPSALDFEVSLKQEEFSVSDSSGGKMQTISVDGRADIVRYEVTNSDTQATKRKTKKCDKQNQTKDIDSANVSIWEIKFVAQLSLEHVIQACVYAYLWCNKHDREIPPRLNLFNVRDGEKWEIVPREGVVSLRRVLEDSLRAKYTSQGEVTTEEFLEKCRKTVQEVEKMFERADK